MALDRPDKETFVFQCDRCPETLEFNADEGHPVADTAACIRLAKEAGWSAKKVVGYDWEHYCPDCTKLPEDEKIPLAEKHK